MDSKNERDEKDNESQHGSQNLDNGLVLGVNLQSERPKETTKKYKNNRFGRGSFKIRA